MVHMIYESSPGYISTVHIYNGYWVGTWMPACGAV